VKNSVLTELRKLIQYQILLLEENEAGYRFVLFTSPGSCAPCRYLEETLDTRQQALVTKADPVNRSRAEWRIQDGAKLWEKVTNVAEFLGDDMISVPTLAVFEGDLDTNLLPGVGPSYHEGMTLRLVANGAQPIIDYINEALGETVMSEEDVISFMLPDFSNSFEKIREELKTSISSGHMRDSVINFIMELETVEPKIRHLSDDNKREVINGIYDDRIFPKLVSLLDDVELTIVDSEDCGPSVSAFYNARINQITFCLPTARLSALISAFGPESPALGTSGRSERKIDQTMRHEFGHSYDEMMALAFQDLLQGGELIHGERRMSELQSDLLSKIFQVSQSHAVMHVGLGEESVQWSERVAEQYADIQRVRMELGRPITARDVRKWCRGEAVRVRTSDPAFRRGDLPNVGINMVILSTYKFLDCSKSASEIAEIMNRIAKRSVLPGDSITV
jgi:hypothetical protein